MNPARLLVLLVSLPLLLGGCGEKHEGEKHEGVNLEELEISGDILNEIAYHKGSPYTGKRYGLHLNGQKSMEGNYKDGKEDGLWVWWYENGQKEAEINWKNGKQDGLHLNWYENGQKAAEGNNKDGKLDGPSVMWHKNGQKKSEANFKNGKLISDKYWNRKGDPVDSFEEAEAE